MSVHITKTPITPKGYKQTEVEIKNRVADNKWLATFDTAIHGEVDRIEQTLNTRVKELADRYSAPVSELTDRVAELETKVQNHLERMGFSWN